ncbi:hypothetical protein BEWA_020840 [Theileria equi strain WA]|uniref:Uncharacterized protein n=1 Tax=Theileria equi strain WA TaxID=1537102 RepID=L0AUC4_THEEQ|nr:hypothetical protein BEWA_020840 [Theileria equi strain WA]AFZ79237.1 hypothetical protein BEWA_020840 [Theileria equi strain WA]|eukprot:XP_004828903.1 hypothetical protein BEWA_020840 [Theileria equi strain WA]
MESRIDNPTFTIDLKRDQDYSLAQNAEVITVSNNQLLQIDGYNVCLHKPTKDGDYKVNKFLFGGEQEGLPKDLQNVTSVNVFVPETDSVKLIVRVCVAMVFNNETINLALYFVEDTENWSIYLYMEDFEHVGKIREVIDIFNCTDPLELSFNHDALFKIQLENLNSQIEEAATSYLYSKYDLWTRITRWVQELFSLPQGLRNSHFAPFF